MKTHGRNDGSTITKYKNIYLRKGKTQDSYDGRIIIEGRRHHTGRFKTAHEAARALDISLIKNGLEPINILKKVDKLIEI